MAEIFISYSHQDSDYAHRFADELHTRQFDVWIDDRIDYGDQWPRVIQENLASCRIFIVIMSPRAFNSTWVHNELTYAQTNQKTIFPLLLEGDVWVAIAAMQYVDVRQGNMPPERFFERLRKELNKPPPSASQRPVRESAKSSSPSSSNLRTLMYILGSCLLLGVMSLALLYGSWRYLFNPPGSSNAATVPPASEIPVAVTSATTPPTEIPTPTPIYRSGVITFIARKESGEVLYLLERDGSQRPLLEQPDILGIIVLSVSPPGNDPSAPRYLAVSYLAQDLKANCVVLNTKDTSVITIAEGADRVQASYLEDGRLFVEVREAGTATYTLRQMDGSNPTEIYTTVLSVPTVPPATAPESTP